MRNILSNELVAKDQSFPRLNESRRAGYTFSRGLCGARTVLDLDNYAERKKGGGRERERRGSRKWKMANGYDDYYDAPWHLFPPDYAEEEYR